MICGRGRRMYSMNETFRGYRTNAFIGSNRIKSHLKGKFNVLHMAEEMEEDIECKGEVNSNSNGVGTAKWVHTLKLMVNKNECKMKQIDIMEGTVNVTKTYSKLYRLRRTKQ
jgi:hypothetical protein